MHFVLTGSAAEQVDGPAGDVVFGGEEVGEDLGYGALRLLHPDAVLDVARWLETQDPTDLVRTAQRSAVDPELLYGGEHLTQRGMDQLLASRIETLRRLYSGCAERGAAMGLWMT